MSFDEGKAYNEKLMPLARGDALPNSKFGTPQKENIKCYNIVLTMLHRSSPGGVHVLRLMGEHASPSQTVGR